MDENKNTEQFVTYESSYSVLVHTPKNLKRVYCPFKVKKRSSINPIGEPYKIVHQVSSCKEHKICFFINDQWEPYSTYEIF